MKVLEDIFVAHRDKRFIFVQPGGNWGDYLIYFGLECLAKKLNLSYTSLALKDFLTYEINPGEVVYIHGGGAFNSWSSDSGFRALEHATASSASEVIYGPCTSSEDIDFLNEKFKKTQKNNRKFFLFAREHKTLSTFNRLDSLANVANILIDVDTAFHSTKSDLLNLAGPEQKKYTLFGYRHDKEESGLTYQVTPQFLLIDPPNFAKSFAHWVRLHSHARGIITNRTHSSIVGAILGKPTKLFDNSYHKNRSIWEYSLSEKGVSWIDAEQAGSLVKSSGIYKMLPSAFLKSWKVNAFSRKIRGIPES